MRDAEVGAEEEGVGVGLGPAASVRCGAVIGGLGGSGGGADVQVSTEKFLRVGLCGVGWEDVG